MKDKDERSELRGLLPRGKKAWHNAAIVELIAHAFAPLEQACPAYFSALACAKRHKSSMLRIALKDPVINRKIII